MKNGKPMAHPILPTADEMKAAARILRGCLHASHPMVQRCVAESLHDSRPADALSFCEKLEASLLAIHVPVLRLNSHPRPRLVGVPLLDPRD